MLKKITISILTFTFLRLSSPAAVMEWNGSGTDLNPTNSIPLGPPSVFLNEGEVLTWSFGSEDFSVQKYSILGLRFIKLTE